MPPYAWCSGTTRWRMFRRVGYMLLSPQSFVLLLSLLPFAFTLVCQECVNFSLMRWAPAGPSWTEVPVQPKTIRHPCQVLVEVKKEGFIMAEMEASTQVSGLPNFPGSCEKRCSQRWFESLSILPMRRSREPRQGKSRLRRH